PARGDTVQVAIDYGGHPTSGFYAYPEVAYTLSEPEDARGWFPCRDVPWDKATLSLHGHVPADRVLIGNGVLDSASASGTGRGYHWREDPPIATYLISAAISNYASVSAPSSVTPLGWNVYPAHATAADSSFRDLPEMVAFFDSTLAPYPFDKYVMCEASIGGGMENQSATLIGSFVVTGGARFESV